jgi:hypothetical protein
MKSSSKAPDPDPNIGISALMQAQTGRDYLTFAKEAFAVSTERQKELDALTKQVTQQQLDVAKDQTAWARTDRERYEKTFRPIEDSFVKEATEYGSPEKQEAAAAEAKADVQAAIAAQRGQAEREAASLGINPASGRYAGITRAGELGGALASAGAQNTARTMQRDKGLALKADVVNLGRGLPAQAAGAAGLGLSAGSSAVGLQQRTDANYLASTDIMGAGYKGQMTGYAGQGDTLNRQYSTQVSAWDAQNRADAANAAGIGQALGGVLGLIISDEKVKKDKKPVAEGKGLTAVKKMPVKEFTYKEGVADGGRHVGPMAQDFKAATGKGDGKTIAVQDAIGVTMKAVQDLDSKIVRLEKTVRGLARKPEQKTSGLRRAA